MLRFLVIFPAIVQRIVNDASLPVHSVKLLNPTEDSVTFSMVASLKIPSGLTADTDPLTLDLYASSGAVDPYLQVTLPSEHLKGNTTVSIVNETTTILSLPIFESFLENTVSSDTFTITAKGSTTVHVGLLKAHVTFNKNIQLVGM